MVDILARMRQLIGSTAEWNVNNLVPGRGELAMEVTGPGTLALKIGDGVTAFSGLAYFGGTGAGGAYLPLSGGQLSGDLTLNKFQGTLKWRDNTAAVNQKEVWWQHLGNQVRLTFKNDAASAEHHAFAFLAGDLPLTLTGQEVPTIAWVRAYVASVGGGGGGGGLPIAGGTLTGNLRIEHNAYPALFLKDTDNPANLKEWAIFVDATNGMLRFSSRNDLGTEQYAYGLAPYTLATTDDSNFLATTAWVRDFVGTGGGTGYLPISGGVLTGNVVIATTSLPGIGFKDTDAPTDLKEWHIYAEANGVMRFSRRSDLNVEIQAYGLYPGTLPLTDDSGYLPPTAWVRDYVESVVGAAGSLPIGGGTLTGNLVIHTPAGPSLWFDDDAAPVNYRRWRIMVDDANGRLRFGRFDGAGVEQIAYTLFPDFLTAGESSGALATTQWVWNRLTGVAGVGGYLPLAGGTLSGDLTVQGNLGVGVAPAYKLDVQGNFNTGMVGRLYNWSQGASAQAIWQINAGTRFVNYTVDYTGKWAHEFGNALDVKYYDFAQHIFRNHLGITQMTVYTDNIVFAAPYVYATTPGAGDSSQRLATTQWCRLNNIGVAASGLAGMLFWAQPSTTQSIAQYSPTKINLGFEHVDKAGALNLSIARFVAPSAGYFQFHLGVGVDTLGYTFMHSLQLVKNGDTINQAWKNEHYVGSTDHAAINLSLFMLLNAGDYVEMFYWHSAPATLTISTTPLETFFQGYYLGPL